MQKTILLFLLLVTASLLAGKSLDPGLRASHITVTELPWLNGMRFSAGPHLRQFRCTNHTMETLDLEIEIHSRYRRSGDPRIFCRLQLPGLAVRNVTVFVPQFNDNSTVVFSARSRADVHIKINTSDPLVVQNIGIGSPSFRPDHFEYLWENIVKAPLPVKEWPDDSRAYAGCMNIILDSADELPPGVERALRLAAARGSHVLVMVMGDAPWPSYAGVEKKNQAHVERIGFGLWAVFRSRAVDSNPAWKNFVKKKHAAARKGKWKREYKQLRWHEFRTYLRTADENTPLASKIRLPQPPVPIKMLMGLMCVFVILIGPVNYFVLKKRNAQLWCLVTIPVLSLLFTGAVIIGAVMYEGISSRGKGAVETRLDQVTGMAVSRGGFGIYSPLSAGEFRFDKEDLLYFRQPGKVLGTAGDAYVFASGLLRPRLSFSYGVVRSEFRREKISVSEKKGKIEVVNGLGIRIDKLLLCSSGGECYKLSAPLPPGARSVLTAVPKLSALENPPKAGHYRAGISAPFMIRPGVMPRAYEHAQTIYGRWR